MSQKNILRWQIIAIVIWVMNWVFLFTINNMILAVVISAVCYVLPIIILIYLFPYVFPLQKNVMSDKEIKKGEYVECIENWRGQGTYWWGGSSAYIKGEKYKVKNVYKKRQKDQDTVYIIEDKKYGSFDILYENTTPLFSTYFKKI